VKVISAAELAKVAPYSAIVEALREGFRADITTPVRHHHETSAVATLLLMPAWSKDWTGLKTVVVKSDNAAKNLPTIQASYLLIKNDTGETVPQDGTELTGAPPHSAFADYLAARCLNPCAGRCGAWDFVRAHAAVRPIKRILIYNRSPEKAEALAAELKAEGLDASGVVDLEKALGQADIVSCVTASTTPLVRGEWLKPGTHVDLAGAFRPTMRETDGDVVARARVYVDTREGALSEAGDLLQARDEGKFVPMSRAISLTSAGAP
jgi:ornithine cyclodeaminase